MDRAVNACGCGEVHEPLISIEDASGRAAACVTPLNGYEEVPLWSAAGRILAQAVKASLSMPRFDQSAMDGYAVLAASLFDGSNRLPVSQRILAGDAGKPLATGTVARIFTGAQLPPGADAVVMQEQARERDGIVELTGPVLPGAHVRRMGEDVREGEALLRAGLRLGPRHVAVLASQGHSQVAVRRRPVAAILSTGSELRAPGAPLSQAALYDSNRPMLMALAEEDGFSVIDGGCLPDDARLLTKRLAELADRADLVVSSAGASVGDEDNSLRAAGAAGFRCDALRIAMKPGKPAVVGRRGSVAYLGLPGNPFSAFLSWRILGGAMTAAFAGVPASSPCGLPLPAVNGFAHKPGRTEFVPAQLRPRDGGMAVELLGHGVSGHLKPLVAADGLAEIDAAAGAVSPGQTVRFHPFCHSGGRS